MRVNGGSNNEYSREIARRMERTLSLDELAPGTDTVTSKTFSLDNNK